MSNFLHDNKKDLTGRFCPKFFIFFEVSTDGRCWLCCPSWLPVSIGNILEQDFQDIWNGPEAQKLRRQVFDNKWDHCVHTLCPMIQSDILPKIEDIGKDEPPEHFHRANILAKNPIVESLPTVINLSEDRSCNLHCPSCRLEKILHAPGSPAYEKAKRINDRIYEVFFSEPTDRRFQLNVTGSGDPFASRIYREFLQKIDGSKFPNLYVNLFTNGVMFTPKMWHSIRHIHDQLGRCRISLDAGTKDTYENKTRLGGNWDLLLENCDFLNERSKEHERFELHFDFVVQQCNYQEMATYAKLILDRYDNAAVVHFNKLHDWNTWDREEYLSRAVWIPEHPEYHKLVEVLQDPVFDHPKVLLGNLSTLRNR